MSDNELISNFMGSEKIDLVAKFGEGWAKIIQRHAPEGTEFPPYDKSWDWLMPACKKWDSLKFIPGKEKEQMHLCDDLDHYASCYDIEPVFRQLVINIQWYNSNKQTQ